MIDRKTVLTNLKNYYAWKYRKYPLSEDEADVIIEALEQPQVVRCKDCKYNKKNPYPYAKTQYSCDLGNRFKLRDCESFGCVDGEVKNENQ